MMGPIVLLLCCFCCVVVEAGVSPSPPPVIRISSGEIQGTSQVVPYDTSLVSWAWLGIPYAAPPIPRWKAPQAPAGWEGSVRNTTSFGAGCPQNCMLPPGTCPLSQSEDCLTLNIWAPQGALSKSLPVLVFLPGGRFEQGGSDTYLYDGRFMVTANPMIVVTVNYRLGALGFLYAPELGVSGSFGALDQLFALKWVQKNIAAFGGDPARVTLSGQSAGGMSTTYHLLSPLSRGLFRAAVVQSNPIALPWKDGKTGATLGKHFYKDLNCETNSCLQAASVSQVLAAQTASQKKFNALHPLDMFVPWTPVVGTSDFGALEDQPLALITSGRVANPVPLILGTVSNETTMFIWEGLGHNPSEALYIAFLGDVFPLHALRILKQYPPHSAGSVFDTFSVLGTDYIMECPARFAARSLSANTSADVFLYYFDHVMSFSKVAWGPQYSECYNLTCHAEELVYLFGTPSLSVQNGLPAMNFTPEEKVLSKLMQQTWFSHVSGSGAPWPAYTSSAMTAMLFGTPSIVGQEPRAAYCDFWDSIGYHAAERFVAAIMKIRQKRLKL